MGDLTNPVEVHTAFEEDLGTSGCLAKVVTLSDSKNLFRLVMKHCNFFQNLFAATVRKWQLHGVWNGGYLSE